MDAELSAGTRLALFFAVSFGLGIAMAKVVEVPVLRVRDRWFPSRSPGAVGDGPNQALHLAPAQTGGGGMND